MAKKRGHGEGSIYEESPGKWVASLTVGYKFVDGKRKRIRKKFTAVTRREVAQKLTDALKLQQGGYNLSPNRLTVASFLKHWIENVIAAGEETKPKTLQFYRYIVDTHLTPAIGTIKLEKLTPVHVRTMLNEKRKLVSERTGRALTGRTVMSIQRTLRTALQCAVDDELLSRNPASINMKGETGSKVDARFLQVDEAKALLAAASQEPMYYALFATILSLGIRLGEALGLGWDDIDFGRRRLHIRHTLQRVQGEIIRLDPKSSKSRRSIDLPAVTIAALSEHQHAQQNAREWAGSGWKGNAWNLVFTTSIGSPVDERNALRVFQERILKAAGLPKMRIHDLRHSAAAILIAQGVHAKAISEILGHSSVSFTLQTYGHLLEETKREIADKMDAALSTSKPLAPQLAALAVRDKIQ